jgi:predicted CopG family antitoxin
MRLCACVGNTTVQVSNETWKALNRRREPGESFDDVLQKILEHE